MDNQLLIAAARDAARNTYSPYSGFGVGAALLFDDGHVVTGTNIENASYGLTLCAETVAVGKAMAEGRRGGLLAVAVIGPQAEGGAEPVTPCGRCRQMLNELASLGGTDPNVYCVGAYAGADGSEDNIVEIRLSDLLPRAFGPDHLSD